MLKILCNFQLKHFWFFVLCLNGKGQLIGKLCYSQKEGKTSERFAINSETRRRNIKKKRLDPEHSCDNFSDACSIRRVFKEAEEQTLVDCLLTTSHMGCMDCKPVHNMA